MHCLPPVPQRPGVSFKYMYLVGLLAAHGRDRLVRDFLPILVVVLVVILVVVFVLVFVPVILIDWREGGGLRR